jgi:undecaprenyl-diphosphatase
VTDVRVRGRAPSTAHDRPTVRERLEPAAHAWRPLVGTWIVLFAVVTAAGLLLVGPFADGSVARADLHLAQWFADHRTPLLDVMAESGTWLAETITVPAVLVVAIIVTWRVSDAVAAPVFLALAVGGEKLLYLLSSVIVGRDRPPVPTVGTSYATSSFPSGHVASAVTLYGAVALVIALRRSTAVRRALLALVGVIATVVALCRMYCGFHYLSDTIAGAIVGAIWLTVVYRTVLRETSPVPAAAGAVDSAEGARQRTARSPKLIEPDRPRNASIGSRTSSM